jgi:hypothetical protein
VRPYGLANVGSRVGRNSGLAAHETEYGCRAASAPRSLALPAVRVGLPSNDSLPALSAYPFRARWSGEPAGLTVIHGERSTCSDLGQGSSGCCGPQPSKLVMRVRFPSPAPSTR